MARYVMVVQSRPVEGREDEYNDWYDRSHFADILALPGVTGGRRLEATPFAVGGAGLPYLSLFEIETDDPATFMAEMGRRSHDGTMTRSDALDGAASVLWVYRERAMLS